MSKFIKLTNIHTEPQEFYINMDLVLIIKQKEGYTEVYDFDRESGSYEVKETPEEIIELIKGGNK